jgi:hypothetical protein
MSHEISDSVGDGGQGSITIDRANALSQARVVVTVEAVVVYKTVITRGG